MTTQELLDLYNEIELQIRSINLQFGGSGLTNGMQNVFMVLSIETNDLQESLNILNNLENKLSELNNNISNFKQKLKEDNNNNDD